MRSISETRALIDILDEAAVVYDLSDDGMLFLEADYNGVLDMHGICYCEM